METFSLFFQTYCSFCKEKMSEKEKKEKDKIIEKLHDIKYLKILVQMYEYKEFKY